jgi:3-methyl-2-oxobutanoate hydroxymethyltransferase
MATQRRMTVPRFVAAKAAGQKLSMVTAYDYSWAQIMDEAGVDSVLVGDSLGMVVQGKSSTVPVTLDEIIYHGEMVARAVQRALVIVDLPFMTYQISPQQALASAGRIIKETGAQAVKLEGGEKQAATIRAIAEADIPVMAHVGMQPQSISKLGGHGRIQRLLCASNSYRVRLPPKSRPRPRSRRSVSAPGRTAMGRFSSHTTCWGSRRRRSSRSS